MIQECLNCEQDFFRLIDTQWSMHANYMRNNISGKSIEEWNNVDTSKYKFPSEIWVLRPTWEVVVKVVTILLVFVIGVLANISLVYIIARTKSLHTTTNLLIMNMAIADLGICTLCPWMLLCIDIFQNYVLGHVGCRMDGFTVHALTMVAVFSLSAISYDQLVAIVFNCSGKLSVQRTKIVLVITWMASTAVAGPLAYFRKYMERKWNNYFETFCTEASELVYTYWHIFVGFSVWAPLAIMAICYTAILIKLNRYESRALKSKHPIVIRHKGRVARILALVVLAFIICRVPFTALVFQRAQLHQSEAKLGQAENMYLLWYIGRFLVLANAALNPILYGFTSGSLRRELLLCPGISWILKKKTQTSIPAKAASQCSLVHFDNLKPRSPCIRDNKRVDSIQNISSSETSMNAL